MVCVPLAATVDTVSKDECKMAVTATTCDINKCLWRMPPTTTPVDPNTPVVPQTDDADLFHCVSTTRFTDSSYVETTDECMRSAIKDDCYTATAAGAALTCEWAPKDKTNMPGVCFPGPTSDTFVKG